MSKQEEKNIYPIVDLEVERRMLMAEMSLRKYDEIHGIQDLTNMAIYEEVSYDSYDIKNPAHYVSQIRQLEDDEARQDFLKEVLNNEDSESKRVWYRSLTMPYIGDQELKHDYIRDIKKLYEKRPEILDEYLANTMMSFQELDNISEFSREECRGFAVDCLLSATVASLDNVYDIMRYYQYMTNPYVKQYILNSIGRRPEYQRELTNEELDMVSDIIDVRIAGMKNVPNIELFINNALSSSALDLTPETFDEISCISHAEAEINADRKKETREEKEARIVRKVGELAKLKEEDRKSTKQNEQQGPEGH